MSAPATFTVERRYGLSADAHWARIVRYDELSEAMEGQVRYVGLPEGEIVEGQAYDLKLFMFGWLPIGRWRIEVLERNDSERRVRSFEQGGQRIDVLRGIDLDIMPGEIVALLGSSGCGKTSTLRMTRLRSTQAGSPVSTPRRRGKCTSSAMICGRGCGAVRSDPIKLALFDRTCNARRLCPLSPFKGERGLPRGVRLGGQRRLAEPGASALNFLQPGLRTSRRCPRRSPSR